MPPGYYFDYPNYGNAFANTLALYQMANPQAFAPQGAQASFDPSPNGSGYYGPQTPSYNPEEQASGGGGYVPSAAPQYDAADRGKEGYPGGGGQSTQSLTEQAKAMGISLNQLLAMQQGQPPLGMGLAA